MTILIIFPLFTQHIRADILRTLIKSKTSVTFARVRKIVYFFSSLCECSEDHIWSFRYHENRRINATVLLGV